MERVERSKVGCVAFFPHPTTKLVERYEQNLAQQRTSSMEPQTQKCHRINCSGALVSICPLFYFSHHFFTSVFTKLAVSTAKATIKNISIIFQNIPITGIFLNKKITPIVSASIHSPNPIVYTFVINKEEAFV